MANVTNVSNPSHGGHAHHEGLGHVSSIKTLFGVFGALMVLTVITVAAIHINMGSWNIVVAMLIATVKASLVALYFMHLRYDTGFVRIAFASSILFLFLFLAFALMDSGAYQNDIQWHELLKPANQAVPAAGAPAAPAH